MTTSAEAIAALNQDDWAVIYFLTLDASPEVREKDLARIRKRYPAETLPGAGDQKYTQPYAAWCKVHRVVTARAAEGHVESPLPEDPNAAF